MTMEEAIISWCLAQNEWHRDIDGSDKHSFHESGYPKVTTRINLYRAGRRLFDIAGIKPRKSGLYSHNWELEEVDDG